LQRIVTVYMALGSHSRGTVRELSAADFAPLDEFPLLGRWTRRTHDLLPSDALATIRPLAPSAAAALAPEAVSRCEPRAVSDLEMTIRAEWDAPQSVRDRLAALPIPPDERVILSWSHDVAVETRWKTFVRYWDAFCYPSTDDVTVWSLGGDWTLCYRHFQVIQFGRARR
jgi:hypothetical protein